jgi:hypothetical protein
MSQKILLEKTLKEIPAIVFFIVPPVMCFAKGAVDGVIKNVEDNSGNYFLGLDMVPPFKYFLGANIAGSAIAGSIFSAKGGKRIGARAGGSIGAIAASTLYCTGFGIGYGIHKIFI